MYERRSLNLFVYVYIPRFNYLITISSNSTDKEHLMSPPIRFIVFLSCMRVYVCVCVHVDVYVCMSQLSRASASSSFHLILQQKASKFSLKSNPYLRRTTCVCASMRMYIIHEHAHTHTHTQNRFLSDELALHRNVVPSFFLQRQTLFFFLKSQKSTA